MEIKWSQLLFQIINFGVLVWLLNRFLYRPILKIVEMRNKKIEDSIKAAEMTLKEKEKLSLLKQQARAEAEKEAVAIIEKAKKTADSSGKEIINEAQKEAELAVDKKMRSVRETIAAEEKRLTQKLGQLVVATTRQLLQTSLTAEEQKRILDRQIKQLKNFK